MLVNKIEWVPLEIEVLIDGLTLPKSMEGLVQHHVDVDFEGLVEALLLHVFTVIKMR